MFSRCARSSSVATVDSSHSTPCMSGRCASRLAGPSSLCLSTARWRLYSRVIAILAASTKIRCARVVALRALGDCKCLSSRRLAGKQVPASLCLMLACSTPPPPPLHAASASARLQERLYQESFSQLTRGQFKRLMGLANIETVPAGTTLTVERSVCNSLYFVLDGCARMKLNGEHVALIEPGGFCNTLAYQRGEDGALSHAAGGLSRRAARGGWGGCKVRVYHGNLASPANSILPFDQVRPRMARSSRRPQRASYAGLSLNFGDWSARMW